MATKKDLVEAHSFSRRRLVTAFVSGAPGGREVEPVRPGRVLIGGVALSVLLLAGAAIAGFLLGRPPAQWLDEGSFVISKDTGEQYVVLTAGDDPMLQRVPNYVSAQLLLGQADLSPNTVRDSYIREVGLGSDLGIEGAPASLPGPDGLIDDGWTACTAPGQGIKVVVQDQPSARELSHAAFLVADGKKLWLIAPAPDVDGRDGRAYRLEMPADRVQADTIADQLGFGASTQAPQVDDAWLNLFPLGPPLRAAEFEIDGVGQPSRVPGLQDYRVGDLLQSPTGGYYLIGDGERPQPLTDFAGMLYDAVGARTIQVDEDPRAGLDMPDFPEEWPETLPDAAAGGSMCAVLHPSTDAPARVALADNPSEEVSPAAVEEGRFEVEVQPSGGAYVLSSSDQASSGGTPFVIDTKGLRYELIGPEVPGFIGYGSVVPPIVPSSWLQFFRPGADLSTNAARRVPEDSPASADES